MGKLWNQTTGNNYIDMSVVFTMNGGDGWIQLLDMLQRVEKTCIRGDPNPPADCVKWKRGQKRRNLRIAELVYGSTSSDALHFINYDDSRGGSRVTGRRPRTTQSSDMTSVSVGSTLHTQRRATPPNDRDRDSNRNNENKGAIDDNDENSDSDEDDDDDDDPGYRVYFSDIIHTLQKLHSKRRT
jgi:hypothetical protein